jgi:hypothetical protein
MCSRVHSSRGYLDFFQWWRHTYRRLMDLPIWGDWFPSIPTPSSFVFYLICCCARTGVSIWVSFLLFLRAEKQRMDRREGRRWLEKFVAPKSVNALFFLVVGDMRMHAFSIRCSLFVIDSSLAGVAMVRLTFPWLHAKRMVPRIDRKCPTTK